MIKFVVGFGFGLSAGFAISFFIPSSWVETGLSASSVVADKIDGIKQDHCQAKFLEETQCFQRFSNVQCADMIRAKCR